MEKQIKKVLQSNNFTEQQIKDLSEMVIQLAEHKKEKKSKKQAKEFSDSEEEEEEKEEKKEVKHLYGTPKRMFNKVHLYGLIDKEFELREGKKHSKAEEVLQEIKDYVDSYFIKTFEDDIIMWDTYHKKHMPLNITTVREKYFTGPKSKKHFDVRYYFANEVHLLYKKVFELNKPQLYNNKHGEHFFNTFTGFMHKERPEKFSKEVIENAKKFWDHIFIVWASRNEEQFIYIKKWLCCMIAGRKLRTLLYGRSAEGTGKSTVIEYIINYILGKHLVLQTNNCNVLVPENTQTSNLEGKMLLCLEEPTGKVLNEQGGLDNLIKDPLTNSFIGVRTMYKVGYQVKNHLNVVFFTNNKAFKKCGRRIFAMDISNEKKQKSKYFDELRDKIMRDEVGEYLYWSAIDYFESDCKNFNEERDMPKTTAGQELSISSMHSVFEYIKDKYVLKNKGMDMRFKDFFIEYIRYCKKVNRPCIKKHDVGNYLSDEGIRKKGSGNKLVLKIEADELLAIYKKKNWIHELDEFGEEEAELSFGDDDEKEDEGKPFLKHNGTKNKEIETKVTEVETKVAEVEKKVKTVGEQLKELEKAVNELRNEKAEKYLKRVLLDNWDYKNKFDDIEFDDASESEESEEESEGQDPREVFLLRNVKSLFDRK